MAADTKTVPRKRVPAAERRDALIEAAVHHFAHGGLQGTKVSAIAADVGVAQPYVFCLFPTKRDLFLAAVDRCFEKVAALFEEAAAEFEQNGPQEPEEDTLKAIGHAYMGRITENPDQLLLQLQAYAACGDDPGIQTSVRRNYAQPRRPRPRAHRGHRRRRARRLLPDRHVVQRRRRPRRRGLLGRLRLGRELPRGRDEPAGR